MNTYEDIVKAVSILWPNVIDFDLFVERMTDEQVALITTYLAHRSVSSPRLQIISSL